ncbi:MAG: ribosome silencing factor [Leptospiraceae bacterium]|nr:ribosome silencing factor [Leptospiraceae bacterium]MCZ8345373.1 ribosome silencing factor [Leptospiraceae bacterium]PJD98961.1 MAG: ribosome silencing factor [Leptospira sp.]
MKQNNNEVVSILKEIRSILLDKKCEDINFLDLQDVNSYLTYFVIATAKTNTQARSTAREIDKYMKPLRKSKGIQTRSVTGNSVAKDDSGWLLLDYGDILVHVMEADVRSYYNLERLWGDAKTMELDSIS